MFNRGFLVDDNDDGGDRAKWVIGLFNVVLKCHSMNAGHVNLKQDSITYD